jgi:hypothetical protein
MEAISRTDLQDQASRFARETRDFLREQNAQSHSPNAVLRPLEGNATLGLFEWAYMQFVARRRPVKP